MSAQERHRASLDAMKTLRECARETAALEVIGESPALVGLYELLLLRLAADPEDIKGAVEHVINCEMSRRARRRKRRLGRAADAARAVA